METMTTAQVLSLIDEARGALDEALAGISRERMLAPGAESGWSAKDIMAHIAWSERETVGALQRRALVGSELWLLSQDERNAAVYRENRDRPLDDVQEEARQIFAAIRAEIALLSDAEMNDPALIAGMPGGLTPWQWLAGVTWKHYAEHLLMVQALATSARCAE